MTAPPFHEVLNSCLSFTIVAPVETSPTPTDTPATDQTPREETKMTFAIHHPFRTSLGIALGVTIGLFLPGVLFGLVVTALAPEKMIIPVDEETCLPLTEP